MITSAPPHCVTWFVQCDNLFVSFSWDLQKVRRTLVHTRYIPMAKATSFLAPSGNQSGSAHGDKLVSNSSKMYSHSNWKALVCTCQSSFGWWLHFFSIFNHILELISILFQIGWSHQPDIFYVIAHGYPLLFISVTSSIFYPQRFLQHIPITVIVIATLGRKIHGPNCQVGTTRRWWWRRYRPAARRFFCPRGAEDITGMLI